MNARRQFQHGDIEDGVSRYRSTGEISRHRVNAKSKFRGVGNWEIAKMGIGLMNKFVISLFSLVVLDVIAICR